MLIERELRVTSGDIELFAAASGDRNPLHSDPEFAASTAFGSPIVHGALIATAMLGVIPEQALLRIRSLRVSFSGAMLACAAANMSATTPAREPGAWEVQVSARGRTLARLLARASAEMPGEAMPTAATVDEPPAPMRTTPAEPSSSELQAGRALSGEYSAGPELGALARRFEAGALDPRLLEGLAWSSYVVGMELPGLHSLFAGLTLAAVDGESGAEGRAQSLVVRDHDMRTGQLTIDGMLARGAGEGRALARIQCFALPRDVSPNPAALGLDRARRPERGAVVVAGGSRGFGASLALSLLALGHEVHVAYATSQRRAQELARLAGPHESRLHLRRVDVGDPHAFQSLVGSVESGGVPLVGLVLNAAPPPLAMGLTQRSAEDLADYVAESLRLVAVPLGSLLSLLEEQRGWVLFCSSAAIGSPPRDWPHYVSAKASIEGLAGWLAATKPSLRSVIVRPPKMQTAMTGTPSGRIGATSADAVALWTAERLSGGELEPGLTMLEPGAREAPLTTRQPKLAL